MDRWDESWNGLVGHGWLDPCRGRFFRVEIHWWVPAVFFPTVDNGRYRP